MKDEEVDVENKVKEWIQLLLPAAKVSLLSSYIGDVSLTVAAQLYSFKEDWKICVSLNTLAPGIAMAPSLQYIKCFLAYIFD